MVKEAIYILVDNSEISRNGDYFPSRFDSQGDSIYLYINSKLQNSPQSMLAVMAMSGKRPEVMVNLTSDFEKIVSKHGQISVKGEKPDIISSVKIACLGLKSCSEPGIKFRILIFVCSDILDDSMSGEDQDAVKRNYDGLKKFLRKNGYFLDVVCFGINELSKKLLKELIEGLDGTQKLNNFVEVPARLYGTLSDYLLDTPLINGGGGSQEGGVETAGDEFDLLKMDPNLLSFEQQIRRAELESLRDLRTQQMNQEGLPQPTADPSTHPSSTLEVQIDGVSAQRLIEIVNKDVNDMTEDEILIYTQYCDKINEKTDNNQ